MALNGKTYCDASISNTKINILLTSVTFCIFFCGYCCFQLSRIMGKSPVLHSFSGDIRVRPKDIAPMSVSSLSTTTIKFFKSACANISQFYAVSNPWKAPKPPCIANYSKKWDCFPSTVKILGRTRDWLRYDVPSH